MKLHVVLIIVGLAFVGASEHTRNITDFTEIDQGSTPSSSLKERRWGIIFPKSTQKFIEAVGPIKAQNNKSHITKSTKKPLMIKLTPQTLKIKNNNYWITATRKPLMKYIKFTINPLTTINIPKNTINMDEIRRKKENFVKFNDIKELKTEDSSEESSESSAVDKKHKGNYINKKTSQFHKMLKYKSKFGKIRNDDSTAKSKTRESEFSSEEKEDREEFIFIQPKKINQNVVKAILDSGESNEITTIIAEPKPNKKVKRSINVIEEENLGTTVSGFKFTGKVSSLSNDLVFRNINT